MRKRRIYRAKIKNYLIVSTIICGALLLLSISSAGAYVIELPPHYGLTVKFIGTATESYSNNITFAEDNKDRIEDFVTTLSLGLDLRFEGKKRNMGLTGRINRQGRTGSVDNVNSSENLSANFSTEFSEYDMVKLSNTFTHTQVPGSFEEEFDIYECRRILEERGSSLDEIEFGCNKFKDEFGRFKGKFDSYNNRANFNYIKNISKHLDFSTNYSYTQNWFSEEGTRDSNRNDLGFSVNYLHSVATSYSLSYRYAISNFEDGGDITLNSISAGLEQYLTKKLVVNGSIGVDITPSSTYTSFGASITQPIDIDKRTSASLLFTNEIDISSDREDIFRNWRITGSFTTQMLEHLNSLLSGFYGQGKFLADGAEDKLMGANIALNYTFWEGKKGQRISGLLGYTYSKLDSTDKNRGYTRGTINGGVIAGF